jgi:TolA-binding protein
MMKIFIAILLAFSMIMGCSSVRKGYVKRTGDARGEPISATADVKNIDNKANISQKVDKPKHRFSDTTYIYLSKMEQPKRASNSDFQKAVQIYEAGDYDTSCELFNGMRTEFTESDEIYYDVMFYCSECMIIEDDLYGAESILKELLVNPQTNNTIRQKVLVRLGQVYCVLGNSEMASTLFKKLKQEYPNSVYLPLANCESVAE